MKRILFSLLLAAAGVSASAMNARDAREYAYFLTDKMAYELNLTPLQYERVYEVNLNYFLAVNSAYDVDRFQDYRDEDLRYILSERQYWDYSNAHYFYRPLAWGRGAWEFRIYNRYSYRDNYYFGRPACYDSYQGVNWSYRSSSARSPYWGLSIDFRYGGMRDSYARYYNVSTFVQPYQREPLVIVDGRYGGSGSGYSFSAGRYGGNGGYYVAPSSSYYGVNGNPYRNGQGRVEIYEGRRGNDYYSRDGVYDNRSRYSGYSDSYNYSRGYGGSSTYSVPSQPNRNGANYGTVSGNNGGNYSSGRRSSSVFSAPQRDVRGNAAGQSAQSSNNAGGNYQQQDTRTVNGTVIVGGRR